MTHGISLKNMTCLPRVLAVATVWLAAAPLEADILSTYSHRFTDSAATGGLWHLDATYPDAEGTTAYTPDDTSATGRPARPLELINDPEATTITGNGYYDPLAHPAGNSYLRSTVAYSEFFEQPWQRIVVEAVITTPETNWTSTNQEIAMLNGSFTLRLVRHATGPIADLTIWEAGSTPKGHRFPNDHPLYNLENGGTYYIRAVYDSQRQEIELTVNDQTIQHTWIPMTERPLDRFYVGIRGGDRFRGLIHEVKISQETDFSPPSGGFESWRAAHFTEAERADPSVSGPAADPAGDGIPNLVKYAMGLAPRVPARGELPEPTVAEDRLQITYRDDPAAGDVQLLVEVSTDLVNWQTGAEHVEEVSRTSADAVDWVTVRDRTPLGSAGRRFIRLRAVSQ